MKKTLLALCISAVIFSFGCAEKAEKKEAPKPKATGPAQTQPPRVSGAEQQPQSHLSGTASQGTDPATHTSGN